MLQPEAAQQGKVVAWAQWHTSVRQNRIHFKNVQKLKNNSFKELQTYLFTLITQIYRLFSWDQKLWSHFINAWWHQEACDQNRRRTERWHVHLDEPPAK